MGKKEYEDNGETQIFDRKEFEEKLKSLENEQISNNSDVDVKDVKEAIAIVYAALKEKGYNPTNQIVQYIMSGEPLFITGYNKARAVITKFERDELVEEIVRSYFKNNFE